jgi:hypothetical protein
MFRTLEIGGLVVTVQAAGEIEQSFDDIGGSAIIRMLDGTGIKQSHWRKLRTRITGSGQVPPGLAGLNYDDELLLKSCGARSIQAATNVITVPAARRTDAGYEPRGYAIVNGMYAFTPLALVGDVATLTAVSGAQGYGVKYWPQLTVLAEFSESNQETRSIWSWQIEAEEV